MSASKGFSNILIITCSGGAGHLQAARIKKARYQELYPDANFFELDLLDDWRKEVWNTVLTSGNVFLQRSLGKLAHFASFLFWPNFFIKTLRLLERHKIDLIIDTQVLATHAILQAVKRVEKKQKKTIVYKKIIIELPTKKTQLYFKPVQRLNAKDRAYVQLYAQKPLLVDHQSEEDFWHQHCRLSMRQIVRDEPLLFPEFRKLHLQNDLKKNPFPLQLKLSNEIDQQYYKKTLKKRSHTQLEQSHLQLVIYPSDFIALIMLGSQPAESATTEYCLSLIEKTKKMNGFDQFKLFIFCGHPEKKANFYKRLLQNLSVAELQDHQSIYPLFFQSAEVVAPLIARSDLSITRSGGITSHELKSVSQGLMMIHSECPYLAPSESDLISGMPDWEAGNAEYLKKEKGAIFVTPSIFKEKLENSFSTISPLITVESNSLHTR